MNAFSAAGEPFQFGDERRGRVEARVRVRGVERPAQLVDSGQQPLLPAAYPGRAARDELGVGEPLRRPQDTGQAQAPAGQG